MGERRYRATEGRGRYSRKTVIVDETRRYFRSDRPIKIVDVGPRPQRIGLYPISWTQSSLWNEVHKRHIVPDSLERVERGPFRIAAARLFPDPL